MPLSRLSVVGVRLLQVALLLVGGARLHAAELTEVPLEHLLATDVVSASSYARQITDAASAVSVMTGEDIRVLGLRTLGDVLDHMRGLHVTTDLDYVYLGARGLGGPGSLAGRILLLIDGIPAVDNLYDQPYLGHDQLVDVSVIDRVEYAPGSGSAIYGNNAFLGVINVVTRRGRDVDGQEAGIGVGSWGDRWARATAGRRLTNGAEWLLSATRHRNDGQPAIDSGDLPPSAGARDERVFFKGRFEGYTLEAMSAQRQAHFGERADGIVGYLDRNQLVSLGHDGEPADHWRSSLHLRAARYNYRYADDAGGPGAARWQEADDGTWWALDGQLAYDGLANQRLVLGARARRDTVLRFSGTDYDGEPYRADDHRRSLGLSVEDELALSDDLRATLGVRADRVSGSPWAWNPRTALVWSPAPAWQLKLSHGRATRFPSAAERLFANDLVGSTVEQVDDERVSTSELVAEYHRDALRLLASAYSYRVTELAPQPVYSPEEAATWLKGRGLELEAEWRWRGVWLRGSQAWQQVTSDAEAPRPYSPRTVTKALVSVPLVDERLRGSVSARRTGSFTGFEGTQVPARTLLDLALVSRNALPSIDLSLSWRNVLGQRDEALDDYFDAPQSGAATRGVWLEISGRFR